MPFLGNKPTNNFTSFEKQDITGDGSSAYTLAHAVNNEKDIDLYINHVHQEPTTAYSASGTTLSLTESISSADDCYILFRSRAIQSATPPDGSVNSAKLATDIAIAGDFTVDTSTLKVDSSNNRVGVGTASPTHSLEIDVNDDTADGYKQLALVGGRPTIFIKETRYNANENYQIRVDNGVLKFQQQNDAQQNAVTKMSIDQTGRVTMPSQPSFAVYGVNNDSALTMVDATVTKLQNWDNTLHNIGSHFNASTGVFTAPVAGRYFFYAQVMFRMSTSTYIGDLLIRLRVNGSDYSYTDIGYNDDGNGDGWNTETLSAIVSLSANDTVDVHYYLGSSTHNTGDNTNWYIYHGRYTQFHGHFLG